MDSMAQFITMVLSVIAAFGAFAAWIVRHMDRRFAEARADTQRQLDEMRQQFAEARADTQRQFTEAKADTHQRFAEMRQQFAEAKADTQRQFAEAKADTQRQFDEAKADTHQRFDEMQQQFAEAKADTQRQFDELKADVQRGFERGREDYLRLEKKMEDRFEAQDRQVANLRQDVGRLQGIVERTHQPRRFAVQPVQQELGVRDEVREARVGYDAGHEDEDSEPGSGAAGREDK